MKDHEKSKLHFFLYHNDRIGRRDKLPCSIQARFPFGLTRIGGAKRFAKKRIPSEELVVMLTR